MKIFVIEIYFFRISPVPICFLCFDHNFSLNLMENPNNIISCDFNQYPAWKNFLVLWAPVYGLPVYVAAVYLLRVHSENQSHYVLASQSIAVLL